MPDLPIRYVARITTPEPPAEAPTGVSEVWFLEKGKFTGGKRRGDGE
jgi:hypothetical protein